MFVALNPEGYFVSILHEPDAENQARGDVIEVEDRTGLTSAFRYVDGAWVAPTPVEEPLPEGTFGMARPSRTAP